MVIVIVHIILELHSWKKLYKLSLAPVEEAQWGYWTPKRWLRSQRPEPLNGQVELEIGSSVAREFRVSAPTMDVGSYHNSLFTVFILK